MAANSGLNNRSTADQVLAGKNLSGKVILVTGANTGIGFETARSLAAAGAHVVLACRAEGKALAAGERIDRAHPGCELSPLQLDLSSLESVRDFCGAFPLQRLDCVICNAGVVLPRFELSADGFEKTLAVCHIGHFLLVRELLPRLLAAEDPRVVMVSSESHRQPKTLDFASLPHRAETFSTMKAYGQAKLCNALMAAELQRRYGDSGLTACYLHPGTMVSTEIGRNSGLVNLVMKVVKPFTKTPAQGAATSVFCASWDNTAELAGNYFSHCQRARPSAEARSADVARRLWEITESWVT